MIVKLLTEHHLEFLSFKGGCRGSSESTFVKIPHYWKSHATAQFCFDYSKKQPAVHGWVKVFWIIPELRILRLTFYM